jgi:hypothetical protein
MLGDDTLPMLVPARPFIDAVRVTTLANVEDGAVVSATVNVHIVPPHQEHFTDRTPAFFILSTIP